MAGPSRTSIQVLSPEDCNADRSKLGTFRQIFASLIVTTGIFSMGTVLAYPSVAVPSIDIKDSLSVSEKSWIESIALLGALSSGLFAGYGIDAFGRKNLMVILSILYVLGWCLIPMAHITVIYAGRFITGFCAGGFSLAAPIFISEIADDNIRGSLLSLFQLMMVLGILLTYVAGTFLIIWHKLAYIACAPPTLFLLLVHFIPGTPRYYLSRGRMLEAQKSLAWYRGTENLEAIMRELLKIQTLVDNTRGKRTRLSALLSREVLRPLLITIGLLLLQQLTGFSAILLNVIKICNVSGDNTIDGNTSLLNVSAALVSASIASSLLVDRVGRRLLLICSEALMTISLFLLGGFFYLQPQKDDVHTWRWFPMGCVVSFAGAFALGVGQVPWTMMGELLPPKFKGVTSALATSFVWLTAFIVTSSYEPIIDLMGMHWCFWLYAFFCALGAISVTIFVPETKGKSLEEIQS